MIQARELSYDIARKTEYTAHNFDVTNDTDRRELLQALLPILGKEGAGQCIFSIQTTLANETDYTNQCHEATMALGRSLNETFGDEPSFFDLCPTASYDESPQRWKNRNTTSTYRSRTLCTY